MLVRLDEFSHLADTVRSSDTELFQRFLDVVVLVLIEVLGLIYSG